MTENLNDGQKNAILDRIPMKRLGNAIDISKAGFLCSEMLIISQPDYPC